MAENLYERVRGISKDTKSQFIGVLTAETILPRNVPFFRERADGKYYTKIDLVYTYIRNYFGNRSISLTGEERGMLNLDSIYSGINKEPLKAVGYGIANAECVPRELQEPLSGLENIYLLAGLWSEKYSRTERKHEHYSHRTIVELVCDLIEKGINHMEQVHEHVDNFTKNRRERYITVPQLPYANSIRGDIEEARERVKSEFSKFNRDIKNILLQIASLEREIQSLPLFAESRQCSILSEKQKIVAIVSRCPFPEEFIIRFESVYGANSIGKWLRETG